MALPGGATVIGSKCVVHGRDGECGIERRKVGIETGAGEVGVARGVHRDGVAAGAGSDG